MYPKPVSPSLCAGPSFSPIIRGNGDERHLPVIASFAREYRPSEMMVYEYVIVFSGADRYIMAIRLFRYLASHGLARVARRIESVRPFRSSWAVRDGVQVSASIEKTYVFIG